MYVNPKSDKMSPKWPKFRVLGFFLKLAPHFGILKFTIIPHFLVINIAGPSQRLYLLLFQRERGDGRQREDERGRMDVLHQVGILSPHTDRDHLHHSRPQLPCLDSSCLSHTHHQTATALCEQQNQRNIFYRRSLQQRCKQIKPRHEKQSSSDKRKRFTEISEMQVPHHRPFRPSHLVVPQQAEKVHLHSEEIRYRSKRGVTRGSHQNRICRALLHQERGRFEVRSK